MANETQPTVHVLPVNPLNGPTALFVPIIAQRILAFAAERVSELDPEFFTRSIMTRLYGGDRGLLVLAFVTPQAELVGHAVAEICAQGSKYWVFVQQCKVEGNVGDAVKRAIEIVDQWATEIGRTANPPVKISYMTFATHRNDAAWEKKYGFRHERKILGREIGSPIGKSKDEPDSK